MSKNIILMYDGTNNEYGKHNTNIVKTYELLSLDNFSSQIAFYDPGVGTFNPLGISLGERVGKVMGNAFGAGLQKNIEDGYKYLMNTYKKGDKLFIFGFSRGAFTARALAGMLHRFGLLQKGLDNLMPYVSKMYNKREFDVASSFKNTFCVVCKPHFIGVYDTVASLGYIHSRTFYDSALNLDVKYAYQAVAIDEARAKFPISLWDESKKINNQTIKQVYFSGVHSDIGGSYKQEGLCNIALVWMLDMADKQGIKLKKNWQNKLKQNPYDTLHNSRTGFYKIWRVKMRDIPNGSFVHKSVQDRMSKDKTYAPTNLLQAKNIKYVSNKNYLKS